MADIKPKVAPAQSSQPSRDESGPLPGFKFSAASVADDTVQYLTDFGRFTVPRGYPVAVSCEFHGLAVNLSRFVVPPGGLIIAQLLRNGSPVKDLVVTYSPGHTGVRRTHGHARYEAGDTFDLQVTTSSLGSDVELSATIGVKADH
jgi:hypothetical protein